MRLLHVIFPTTFHAISILNIPTQRIANCAFANDYMILKKCDSTYKFMTNEELYITSCPCIYIYFLYKHINSL